MKSSKVHRVVVVVVALTVLLIAPRVASAGDLNRGVCPNELFTGYQSLLPDCRAYEMVTPSYKDGFLVSLEETSEDGMQLMGRSLGIFSHPVGTGATEAYGIARTSLGWESIPMDAPSTIFSNFGVLATNPELTGSLWTGYSSSSLQPVAYIYYATSPRGPFVLVGPAGPPTVGGVAALGIAGASRDLSHSVYRVHVPNPGERSQLWPGDKTSGAGQSSLYEYSGTSNLEPRLVGVSDEHEVAHISESNLISECGTFLGRPERGAYRAISESGTTIFFTALGRDYGECGGLGSTAVEPPVNELYARLNGSRTVAISEPSETDCSKCDLSNPLDATFQGASADGSKVFFTTTQHLLAGAEGTGDNLYEYAFDGLERERVTLVSDGDPAGARIQEVMQVSHNGSHVYFLAQGVLTSTANAFGQHAEEDAHNLYLYERDSTYPTGHVMFIASGGVGTTQSTPTGRFLVFESSADLTPDEEGQIEAGQVFEYDAQTGSLVRVSRGQNGYNNDGNTSVYQASIPIQNYSPDLPVDKFTRLALSSDGAYVFFTSEDSLTPQALSGVANVYEYHEGQVFLISDGHDLVRIFGVPAVELLGTDEMGRDVFFRTADSLLSQDTDTQVDIYDARAEGGFPLLTRGSICSGDSCQGPLASTPLESSPETVSLGGESMLDMDSKAVTKDQSSLKPSKRRVKPKKKRVKKHISKGRKAMREGR